MTTDSAAIFAELNSDLCAVCTEDGVVLSCNRRWDDLIGRDRLAGLIPEDDRTLFRSAISRAGGDIPCVFTCRCRGRNGTILTLGWRVLRREGQIFLAATDLTPGTAVEEAFRIYRETLTNAFDFSPSAIALWRLSDGACLRINARLTELTGYTYSDLDVKPFAATPLWYRVDDDIRIAAAADDSFRVDDHHLLVRRKDGTLFHGLFAARSIVLFGERCLATYLTDITEQKRLAEDYRLLFEIIDEGFALSEIVNDAAGNPVDWRYLSVNPAYEEMIGFKAADLVGRTVLEVIPDVETHWIEHLERVSRSGEGERIIGFAARPNRHYEIHSLRPQPGKLVSFLTDITERQWMNSALESSRRNLQMQFDAMPLACIVWDDQRRVRSWNPAAEKLFGYPATAALGRTAAELLVPEALAPQLGPFWDRLFSGEPSSGLSRCRTREGLIIICEWTNTTLCDETGAFSGTLSMVQDVTVRQMIDEDLKRAKSAAEGANRVKSLFLANMNHEFRTPLHGIIGMSELLGSTELSIDQQRYLKGISASADQLLALVSDILDFSRIEDERFALEAVPFSLAEVCQAVLQSYKTKIAEKRLSFCVTIDSPVPARLVGDPARLRQLLSQLLDNAVKFTERGEIGLKVTAVGCYEQGALLHFRLRDTGVGIAADKLSLIFDPFVQGDASSTRQHGGTGLGLSIARRLVEKMGGALSVESSPGSGSTFAFDLFFPFPEKSPEVIAPQGQNEEGAGLTVLIAEDQQLNRTLLTALLTQQGHTVVTAEDGAAALQRWRAGGIDVILMDIQMPVMDGIEATARIRAEAKEYVPIIAITAHALNGDILREQGFDAWLPKPLRFSELEVLLGRYRRHRHG